MAAWASRQRGNVTRAQLLAAGCTPKMIRRRLILGSLYERFPGVYVVGHLAEPPLSLECAALLYCAPRAMLSHRTAGRIQRWPLASCPDIEVTIVGRRRRPCPGLRIYSLSALAPHEFRRHHGLPITSPSLTLLDLAGCVTQGELAAALNEARVKERVSDGELHDTLRAHPNRRGAHALAKMLSSEEARFATESETERLCLRLMLKHGLQPDASQVWIGPYRVDFLYEEERLVVEADSYRFHRPKIRFVEDRRRTAYLLGRGYEVFPLTWWDLTERPTASMDGLRDAREARRKLLGLPALCS